MAETLSKRQREETQIDDFGGEDHKRQKSYNHILSILDSEEEEPTQDISSLITTFEQEISSSENSVFDPLHSASSENDPENVPATTSTSVEDYTCTTSAFSPSPSTVVKEDEQENDKERVMRHLLEASDDELGIPNRDLDVGGFNVGFDVDDGFNEGGGGGGFCFSDGLWELEDEAANYYTLLQSELFM